ncbi:hypothetical protein FOXB_06389 [Fusarium oxysporum f. sp. conglutinans Fo5176]|uniref:Uncharacterized protein n=1 Tax=Fusarium oxysporum (strain Fo5176) TaxID=660025 RepID=F9FJ10_FUSOF|nr:hypothetical protein FOXB_06389 [Fusarium oxysporum f. sp. conglutinans Fo5176]
MLTKTLMQRKIPVKGSSNNIIT